MTDDPKPCEKQLEDQPRRAGTNHYTAGLSVPVAFGKQRLVQPLKSDALEAEMEGDRVTVFKGPVRLGAMSVRQLLILIAPLAETGLKVKTGGKSGSIQAHGTPEQRRVRDNAFQTIVDRLQEEPENHNLTFEALIKLAIQDPKAPQKDNGTSWSVETLRRRLNNPRRSRS